VTTGRGTDSRIATTLALSLACPAAAFAAGLPAANLDEIVVHAQRLQLAGTVESASEGIVFSDQLENRPVLRPGEVLEVVPGLVVTQHSGDGKANQYFLRGFNLDHGTDFATRVDGLPVNMPTHAHGQGYSDLNFLLPELVDRIEYRKGTYYAEEGNFSAAGSADIRYKRALSGPMLELQGGRNGNGRAVAAASPKLADGDLLLGAEYFHNDGPWDLQEGFRKIGGLAKYTRGTSDAGFGFTAMGYDGRWRSTDQIPLRAVESGAIDRFGTIDPTDGGRSSRYSVSGDAWAKLGDAQLRGTVYAIDYSLDLISNFTYATDPVNGDQFEQRDRRRVYGGEAAWRQPLSIAGREGTFQAGVQTRYDDIAPVALYRTQARLRYATVREDDVRQWSLGAYASQSVKVLPWLRADAGVRFDRFHFDVASSLAANSGTATDSIASPKLTLVFGPWAKTELFANVGRGFHSNDARGTTIRVDPNDGVTPVDRVSPLVRATGAELGMRTAVIPQVQLAASLWTLQLDSELVFSGDGGSTEPSRASRRTGLELGVYYAPFDNVVVDADLAWTRARYTEPDPAGDRIPNAVESVLSVGVTLNGDAGWFGGARLRYFGPAPLIEDDSARSRSTLLVNVEAGYHFTPQLSGAISVFNVFDRRANDITYFYESQLRGEPAPVADVHFHPVEPRTVRATLALKF
jgi:outer membrane receptor protein involved in Fe transport